MIVHQICVHLSMRKIILFVALIGIISFPAIGQSMKIKQAPGVDITAYNTFRVEKGELMTPADEQRIDKEDLYREIKKAVIQEMELRGYQHVDDSTAQLVVSYVAGAFNKIDSEVIGPMGGTPAASPVDLNQSRSVSHNSRQGFLILTVEDIRGKKELWSAESQVDLSTVDSIRALEGIVLKSYKKFPNKLKKKKKK